MSESVRPSRPDIDLASDLHSFFEELVDAAVVAHGCSPTQAAEGYLTALLTDYAKPGKLNAEALDRPLTLLLDDAFQAAGHERFERLRTLGDGVLYASGFFADHLSTRGVELHYVGALGARAYAGAASMLRGSAGDGTSTLDIFRELAENFAMFVELVSSVADTLSASAAGASSQGVLRLYERWLRRGSSDLASTLVSRGVVPIRSAGGLH